MKPSIKTSVLSSLLIIALLSSCDSRNQTASQNPDTVNAAASSALPEAELVIQGGTLFDMVADSPVPVAIKAIVIRDGRIDRILPIDSKELLPDADRLINANGHYILPGLIDSHVHFRPWVPDASIWKRASLYFGVTSLFDTGPCGPTCEMTGQDANEWIVEYRDYMNNQYPADGPNLYITGKRIDGPAEGGHPLGVKVSNAGEISEYLDHLSSLGVDGVKVESSLPADLRKIVVEEANKRGLPVVGHSRDARESIAAGMKFIEHMWPITSALLSVPAPAETLTSPEHDYLMDMDKAPGLIQLMVENEVFINPTMVGRYGWFSQRMRHGAIEDDHLLESGGLFNDIPENRKEAVLNWWNRIDKLDPAELANHIAGRKKVEQFLKLYTEAGGKVLAATDAGQEKITGIILHRELQMLVDAGISPYRALLGATRWAAESMRKTTTIGTIETGKQADVILLGSNPVENIINSRHIQYVIRKGNVVRSPEDCSVIFPPVSLTCN